MKSLLEIVILLIIIGIVSESILDKISLPRDAEIIPIGIGTALLFRL
jgi:hypothetical protein